MVSVALLILSLVDPTNQCCRVTRHRPHRIADCHHLRRFMDKAAQCHRLRSRLLRPRLQGPRSARSRRFRPEILV